LSENEKSEAQVEETPATPEASEETPVEAEAPVEEPEAEEIRKDPETSAEEPVVEEPAAEEPAPEAEAEEPAVEEEAAPQAEPKKKRKHLPRQLRPRKTRPRRPAPTGERKPVVRQPKPEYERGRRQERRGVVVSNAMDKTIVVKVDVITAHQRYKKVIRRSVKFHAHDEQNAAKVGDVVRIVETRPLSATKRWRLAEVVEAAK
jgi:small subunit ribosomal protein S17